MNGRAVSFVGCSVLSFVIKRCSVLIGAPPKPAPPLTTWFSSLSLVINWKAASTVPPPAFVSPVIEWFFLKVVRDKEILHKAYAATNQSKAACIAWNVVPGNNDHVARNHGIKREIQFFSLSEKFKVCKNGNLVMIVVLNNSEIVFTT